MPRLWRVAHRRRGNRGNIKRRDRGQYRQAAGVVAPETRPDADGEWLKCAADNPAIHTLSAYFLVGTREAAKMPFHARHLAKSGFGEPKTAKLDNPCRCRVRDWGRGKVLGDEGKAVGESASRRLCCLSVSCLTRRFPPPWSVEEQFAWLPLPGRHHDRAGV